MLNSVIIIIFTVPTEAPLNFFLTVLSSSSISVSLEPPRLQSRNGRLIYYNVYITETQIAYYENGSIVTLASVDGIQRFNVSENLTYIIEGLHPSYEYNVKVAAATITGVGPYSPAQIERLPQDGMFTILHK